ncbi:MAG: hypothetical protein U0R19_11435 [Bryobacteraceae bacterium]
MHTDNRWGGATYLAQASFALQAPAAKADASNSMGQMDIRFIDQNGNDVSHQFKATTESGSGIADPEFTTIGCAEPQTSWLILFGVGFGVGVAAKIRRKATQG